MGTHGLPNACGERKPTPNYGEDLFFDFQIAVKPFSGPNEFLSSVSGPWLKLVEYPWYKGLALAMTAERQIENL